ncbi:MAG: dienelactone hydrolase family protein [Chloroflexota bacterium]
MKLLFDTLTDWVELRDPNLHKLTVDGFPMIYRDIHVDEAQFGQKLPLIIGLHGHGIHEGQMETLVGLELEQPFIYVALRGFHRLDDGSYSWFPFQFTGTNLITDEAVVMQALHRLAKFVPAIVQAKNADPKQVYIVGYSMGSGMSQSFMLTYPDLIAGAVAMAGQYFEQVKSHIVMRTKLKNKPLFIGHGLNDPLIPASTMNTVISEYEDLGLDVTYKTYNIPHVVSKAEREDVQCWLNAQMTDSSNNSLNLTSP